MRRILIAGLQLTATYLAYSASSSDWAYAELAEAVLEVLLFPLYWIFIIGGAWVLIGFFDQIPDILTTSSMLKLIVILACIANSFLWSAIICLWLDHRSRRQASANADEAA